MIIGIGISFIRVIKGTDRNPIINYPSRMVQAKEDVLVSKAGRSVVFNVVDPAEIEKKIFRPSLGTSKNIILVKNFRVGNKGGISTVKWSARKREHQRPFERDVYRYCTSVDSRFPVGHNPDKKSSPCTGNYNISKRGEKDFKPCRKSSRKHIPTSPKR